MFYLLLFNDSLTFWPVICTWFSTWTVESNDSFCACVTGWIVDSVFRDWLDNYCSEWTWTSEIDPCSIVSILGISYYK